MCESEILLTLVPSLPLSGRLFLWWQKVQGSHLPSDIQRRFPYNTSAHSLSFKIYKKLERQNEIIFEAEKECNASEVERDDLKGLAKFTKKGEL